ncbi:MAG: hypothetical protein WCO45_10655 [Pseudanabaena sp. ELA607]
MANPNPNPAAILEQIKALWARLSPQLQLLWYKTAASSVIVLQQWQATLSQPLAADANAVIKTLHPVATNTVNALIPLLAKVQPPANTDVTAGALPAADSELVENVQKEVGVAWNFTQKEVLPRIYNGLVWTTEKLDPIATTVWEKVSTFAQTNQTVTSNWQKIQGNDIGKKALTVLNSLWSTVVVLWKKIPFPANFNRFAEKRAGTIALVTLVSLFFILKPAHAITNVFAPKFAPQPVTAPVTAYKPLAKPVKVAPPITRAPSETVEPIPVTDLQAPEKGDKPVDPDKIVVTEIQTKVSEVLSKYGEALFSSVETNFQRGRLVVALTDAWYQLPADKQSQLIEDLQTRASQLKFQKLFVADATQQIVARTSVTGDEMIILRR